LSGDWDCWYWVFMNTMWSFLHPICCSHVGYPAYI
jgi:hypothetical protein